MTPAEKKPKDSGATRIARSTFQLVLMDIPVIGWLLIPLFAWMDHRKEKREEKTGK